MCRPSRRPSQQPVHRQSEDDLREIIDIHVMQAVVEDLKVSFVFLGTDLLVRHEAVRECGVLSRQFVHPEGYRSPIELHLPLIQFREGIVVARLHILVRQLVQEFHLGEYRLPLVSIRFGIEFMVQRGIGAHGTQYVRYALVLDPPFNVVFAGDREPSAIRTHQVVLNKFAFLFRFGLGAFLPASVAMEVTGVRFVF